ncbi:ABC transporter ATP-binding protein [Cytobacillus spongiae]|jgi:fluoroquinolone transport system ATP-binding protein|uniref:ABC transporter ATP-binding protein n=1 Tax=Cytobacillus spongiae TaxID=2901381 RepID=UPI001F3596D6|nr:ABC transporter ATP-binding protein [Cytobacillus spongiae]UII55833.1 ABC transporter ATP-binding protein [Cytobacillus spongiae]
MIEVTNLSYSYPLQRQSTIHEISFSINKGEIFGFLGPSGAGKSTTQKILIGLLKGYQGSVKVLDEEVRQLNEDYYERIGVAFEFPHFYSKFTAYENLTHFRRLYSGPTVDPLELLETVGLSAARDTKLSAFSKGMKMRLNFCRALLNQPDVLFLDEPTSGLDPVNAKMMKQQILALKEAGKTIVLTTHNMALAESICDRVAFMVEGKISLIDSPKQLKIDQGKKTVQIEYQLANGNLGLKTFSLTGLKTNEEFLNLLEKDQLVTIHTQEATLEDIFIDVTGRSLV